MLTAFGSCFSPFIVILEPKVPASARLFSSCRGVSGPLVLSLIGNLIHETENSYHCEHVVWGVGGEYSAKLTFVITSNICFSDCYSYR